MSAKDVLVVSPSMEWAYKRWSDAYDYVMRHFPAGTLQVRKLEIIIGEEKHRIRFISERDQERYTRGFRGLIVSSREYLNTLNSIIEEAIEHDKQPPVETEGLKVLVLCGDDSLHRVFESLIEEVTKKFDNTIVNRGNSSVTINDNYRIRFGYSKYAQYHLEEYDDIILPERSFQKYKYQILEAMK